ncbi:MAG: hypothetical protein AAFN70_21510 [Planctomycetota bacterium]
MQFSKSEIQICRQLRDAGLNWQPVPGHYVFDDDQVLPHTSPFQENVFFVLDLQHFLRYVDSIDAMRQRMFWLPTWEQARRWLANAGISPQQSVDQISADDWSGLHERQHLLRQMLHCVADTK